MRIVCIIPARLKSTRFPKKMLAPLLGKPLIQWVWEAACATRKFDEVAVAIDSPELAQTIESFGGKYYMTSETCASGTDRLIELRESGRVSADLWVNWQGDEPFVNTQVIEDLLQTCGKDGADVWTLKKQITRPEEIATPHISKVVCDEEGCALYFSRHPIPFVRDAAHPPCDFFKHIGMYAFSDQALQKIAHLSPCSLEESEQLEQLRFLYHKLKVRVHETHEEPFGIDLPEHLTRAASILSR